MIQRMAKSILKDDEPQPRKLKDSERSARGLGWEYKRRGRLLKSNPFPAGTLKHSEFIAGWNEYTPPDSKTAHDGDIE